MAEEVMTNQLEFKLLNPTEGNFLQHISWNKEELEATLTAIMKDYEGVVYTEDTMKQAKEDRAALNKLDKAIEDRRKEVKSFVMNPYTEFEKEVKEVRALIQKPVGQIDAQIKEYENKLKEEKEQKIRAVYDDKAGELQSIIPFERLFESRWLNQTVSLKKAQDELSTKIETISRDLETIDGLDGKYKLNAKDVYLQSLDLSKALAENKRLLDLEAKLEEEKRRKEEAQRAAEEARRIAEEQRKAEEEKRAAEEAQKAEQVVEVPQVVAPVQEEPQQVEIPQQAEAPQEETPAPVVEEKKYRIRFQATGTRAQLEALTEYMNKNGIEYGRV